TTSASPKQATVTSSVVRASVACRCRLRPLMARSWPGAQPVADSPDGLDGVAERAQLAPQPQDSVVDRTVALDVGLPPDRIVQVRSANRPPAVAQQEVEQLELGSGEVEGLAIQPGQVGGRVDLQRAEPKRRGTLGAVSGKLLPQPLLAPEQRADA